MLQTCFGTYIIIALFTSLLFIGTFIEAQQKDEGAQEAG